MHELPISKGILSIALETSHNHGSRRVTAIDIAIGELSSIVDDSIQFYFDALSEGTLAEGAQLNFRRAVAVAHCWDCSQKFEVRAPLEPLCPHCGSARLEIISGKEFHVESIEVEDEDSGR
jgi:hydrogenase nickel incorporation protein HypA/HybF